MNTTILKRTATAGAAALALTAMLALASCSDFLNQESKIALTEEEVYSDIRNVAPLVDGLYTTYRNLRGGRAGLMINLGLDESQQGNFQLNSEKQQSGLDKYNGLLAPESPQVSAIWSNRWPLVTTAAKAIDVLGKVEETASTLTLLSEASFFRALGMFELSMFFGEIPVIDVSRSNELGSGRQPLTEVWTYIINDFKKATENLPPRQSAPKRATSGAAWAMLGKAYMCAPEETGLRNYAEAKKCFEEVMKGGYSLVPSYAILFSNDLDPNIWQQNTSESIFELQYENLWPDQNYWEWDCGSRACDSWFGQECYFAGYDFLLPTPFAYGIADTGGLWENGDLRRSVNLRYDFTYDKMEVTKDADGNDVTTIKTITPDLSKTEWTGTTDELEPHIKKWEDYRTDEKVAGGDLNMWNSAKNHPLIRLADIYLLYAECLHRTGTSGVDGDKDAYVMKVRNRAWGGSGAPAMPTPSGDFIKDLMDERMRELCFEGWRRIDLIRTGLFVELVSARNRWAREEHGGAQIPDFYMRYPIPDDEIKTNEDLANGANPQNPGYAR
ncbi:MAG: RagB/SusD family nutrient uptake outer membrane protein [Prevotellaceae bacterium]|nr:RagB/SusD family nutrient uptake outer membrane protein [Prevotellaceae bacterium]